MSMTIFNHQALRNDLEEAYIDAVRQLRKMIVAADAMSPCSEQSRARDALLALGEVEFTQDNWKPAVDGNGNHIEWKETGRFQAGDPVVVVRLANDHFKGYLSARLEGGSFGDEDCPSSYNMPCIVWYGVGDGYEQYTTAIEAVCD